MATVASQLRQDMKRTGRGIKRELQEMVAPWRKRVGTARAALTPAKQAVGSAAAARQRVAQAVNRKLKPKRLAAPVPAVTAPLLAGQPQSNDIVSNITGGAQSEWLPQYWAAVLGARSQPQSSPVVGGLTGAGGQLPVTETAKAANATQQAAMMATNPALARPGPGMPAGVRPELNIPWRTGSMGGDLAQTAGPGFLGGLSGPERQGQSRAPWQPTLLPAPTLSATAAKSKGRRERQVADNATLASALTGTPMAPGSFQEQPSGRFKTATGDSRSPTYEDFIAAKIAEKEAILAGNAPEERVAPWVNPERKEKNLPFDRERGNSVLFDPNNEKVQAVEEERKERADISRRMVTAKAQGRRLSAVQAITERSEERKRGLIDRLLGEGKELTRDLRTPQQNANDDALRIAALTAVGNLGEAATPEMVETIMSGVNVGGGGAAGGDAAATALRTGNRLATTLLTDDPDLSPQDWEKIMLARGTPQKVIDQIGPERFANWADRTPARVLNSYLHPGSTPPRIPPSQFTPGPKF